MSTAELKKIVDDATDEEQQFLFACLSEKLHAHSQEELKELDRRLADMDAGKKRLSSGNGSQQGLNSGCD